MKADLVVNLDSTYIAAQEALKGFKQLPEGAPQVFIYTGNILNQKVLLGLFSLGVGKSAASYAVEYAVAIMVGEEEDIGRFDHSLAVITIDRFKSLLRLNSTVSIMPMSVLPTGVLLLVPLTVRPTPIFIGILHRAPLSFHGLQHS